MQIKDFPTSTSVGADDWLLYQSASSDAYYKIKASNLGGGSEALWQPITTSSTLAPGDRAIAMSDNIELTLPATPNIGDRVEVAVASADAKTIKLLANGKKVQGETVPNWLSFGSLRYCSLLWSGDAFGWIDAVSSLKSSKSYSQIILASNPFVFYRLGESSGSVALDSSPNARTGTYLNAQLNQQGRSADGDKCALFSGNGMIYMSQTVSNPTTFSLEGWFKTANPNGSLFGFSNAQQSGGGNFDRELYLSGGQLRYYAYLGADIGTTQTFNDNNWHCVTLTCSPALGVALWVDGVQFAGSSNGSAQAYNGYWHVGYSVRGGYFTGYLDDMSISPAVVTDIPSRHAGV